MRFGKSFHIDARLTLGQRDAESRAMAFFTGYGNAAMMVADDGLPDGQTQSRAP